MIKQHALWTAVGIWLAIGAGCATPSSDGSGAGGDGQGGASSATGGSTGSGGGLGTGGASSGTGGSSATGTGGASTGAGGSPTTGTGGSSSTGTGGATGTGGSMTGTGGMGLAGASGKGGAIGTGGTTTGTGGTTTATGGAGGKGTGGSATGGATGTGGTGGKGTGGTGTGGSATGGAAGASGPCDVWVATSGNDANPGTAALPVATPQAGYELLCPGVTGAANGDPCSGIAEDDVPQGRDLQARHAHRVQEDAQRDRQAGRSRRWLTRPRRPSRSSLLVATARPGPRRPRVCSRERQEPATRIDTALRHTRSRGWRSPNWRATISGNLESRGRTTRFRTATCTTSADTGILVSSSSSGYHRERHLTRRSSIPRFAPQRRHRSATAPTPTASGAKKGSRRRQRLRRLPLVGQLRRRIRLLRLDRRRSRSPRARGRSARGASTVGDRQQRQRLQDGRRQGLRRARHVELLRLRQQLDGRGLARL